MISSDFLNVRFGENSMSGIRIQINLLSTLLFSLIIYTTFAYRIMDTNTALTREAYGHVFLI